MQGVIKYEKPATIVWRDRTSEVGFLVEFVSGTKFFKWEWRELDGNVGEWLMPLSQLLFSEIIVLGE